MSLLALMHIILHLAIFVTSIMRIIHAYAFFWLAIFLGIGLAWRVPYLKKLWVRMAPVTARLERLPYLQLRAGKYYPQPLILNLIITIWAVVSNLLILLLWERSDILSNAGSLVSINLIVLILFSTEHSTFLHIIGAHQPEFLWMHQALSFVTIVELLLYWGRIFYGKLLMC